MAFPLDAIRPIAPDDTQQLANGGPTEGAFIALGGYGPSTASRVKDRLVKEAIRVVPQTEGALSTLGIDRIGMVEIGRLDIVMNHILAQFTRREAHPIVQFIKYGMAGGAATLVDMVVFGFLAWKVLPALSADEFLVRFCGVPVSDVSDVVRARHFFFNTWLAFIFSNLTAYLINIVWVFEPGRHKRHVEIGLFYAVSLTSVTMGSLLGWTVIRWLGITTEATYLCKLVASLMINYTGRKYFIFKG